MSDARDAGCACMKGGRRGSEDGDGVGCTGGAGERGEGCAERAKWKQFFGSTDQHDILSQRMIIMKR